MPTKHIGIETWKQVEEKVVQAVLVTQKPVKDSQVLDLIIRKGVEAISDDDLLNLDES